MALKEVPLSVFERHEVLFGEQTPKMNFCKSGLVISIKG